MGQTGSDGVAPMTFLGKLRRLIEEDARAEAEARIDPWLPILRGVTGEIDRWGEAKVGTTALLTLLKVPEKDRQAGAWRRLHAVMESLGWTPGRVGITYRVVGSRTIKQQVRGYTRSTAAAAAQAA